MKSPEFTQLSALKSSTLPSLANLTFSGPVPNRAGFEVHDRPGRLTKCEVNDAVHTQLSNILQSTRPEVFAQLQCEVGWRIRLVLCPLHPANKGLSQLSDSA